jgi:hypothetical protein
MELCHGQRASSVLGSGVRSSSKHASLVPAVVAGARGLPHPASQVKRGATLLQPGHMGRTGSTCRETFVESMFITLIEL